ncbi:EAL domain-containing protein [Immundisolibacter sp.]|uniref:putative bifunctional diguanylate cyclase/phosphodiesterase n=1 Tax=Immundisolibacter sp. TaxID=1934948 RepID=UPI0026138B93|nr:EAL domain-containing protein [Immundisolibacter sp.]MDD3651570.1 EAL domain-containing protein [Immundisolibacter sp.]
MAAYVDPRHHWRILLLDLATAPAGAALAQRLGGFATPAVDLRVTDLAGLSASLRDGGVDAVLVAADSPAAIGPALVALPAGDTPLILAVHTPADAATVAECRWPAGCVWLRRDFSAGELLAALVQGQINRAFLAAPDGLLLARGQQVLLANPAANDLLNLPTGAPIACHTLEAAGPGSGEQSLPDGRTLAWHCRPLEPAGALTLITVHDVTEHRAAARALEFRAEHDTLTGLANKVRLQQALEAALARAKREGDRVAVLYIDLDGFKAVNDMHGHEVGDALLIAVAERLSGIRRSGELLARIGGDELVMLAQGFPPGLESRIAERVLTALNTPVQAAGRALHIGLSIGVAVYPDHASDADGLLRAADEAMYAAKRSGGNRYQVAHSHVDAVSRRRQEIATGLSRGLLRGEFHLLYQPLLNLEQQRFVGAEALLRWHHPSEGVLLPQQFLDVAEASGIIADIGDWVLERLCAQLAQWRWRLGEEFFLSANLAVAQLRRPDFAGRFRRVLHSHGLGGDAVHLEVSERIIAQEIGRAVGDITGATDMHLAVDDVSQGLLSLRNLGSLPIRSLKLDHGLIAGLPHDALSARLVTSLIGIGRSFGLAIVAEGVENAAQLRFLRQHGCDYCQGFLLSAPVAASELPALVDTPELLRGLLSVSN